MKNIYLISAILLLSGSAFGAFSESAQKEIVENIAKRDRRQAWQGGFTNVESQVDKPSKADIDEFMKGNKEIEEPLERNQISSIYACFHRPQVCQVYTIDIYSNAYGGSGTSRRWVLLDPRSGRYRSFLHGVYSE